MDANQRKKFSRTVLQYLQDPEKANVLRKLLLETDTQNTGSFPEAKQTLRDKIGTFWGSTPIWAVIGMIVGIVASQLSLKLLFIAAWGITLASSYERGSVEKVPQRYLVTDWQVWFSCFSSTLRGKSHLSRRNLQPWIRN